MSFDEKKISVIVPIYNGERYLRRCIESIITQEYKNIEIVLINDGSTDNSKFICKEYMNKDSRIVYLEQKKSGVSKARNLGVSVATGDYLGFVDCDDYIEPNMYEKMVNKMEKDIDLIMCNIKEETKNGLIDGKNIEGGIYDSKSIINAIFDENIEGNVWRCLFSNAMIRKFKIEFAELKLFEDLVFIVEYCLRINKVYVLNDKCYIYNRINQASVVHNMGERRYLSDFTIFPEILCNVINKYGMYDAYSSKIAKEYVIIAMRIRLMTSYKEFKKICKCTGFLKYVDKKCTKKIEKRKYRIYYWGLCNNAYWICNIGYYFNYIKSRLLC